LRLSFSHVLSEHLKIKIFETVILPVWYGMKLVSHPKGRTQLGRVFEKMFLRRIFAYK
jgi:hypothetical protein